MGKASTAKKIQRVQRAGVARSAGTRRAVGFPALCVAIVILGCVGIFFARSSRLDAQQLAPVANQDHWHYAYGLYDCDHYLPALTDAFKDANGIHTHGDGLIHIHPFVAAVAGKLAQLDKFATQTGLTITSDSFTPRGGQTYKNGDTCGTGKNKKTAEVVLFSWPPQANSKTVPDIIRGGDIATFRFTQDKGIIALALVPKGTSNIPLPPSVSTLKNPNDVEGSNPTPAATTPVATTTPASTAPTATTAKGSTTVAPTTTAATQTTVKK